MKNNFLNEAFYDSNGFFCVTLYDNDGRCIRMRMTTLQAIWWLLRLHFLVLMRRGGLTSRLTVPIAGTIEEGKSL